MILYKLCVLLGLYQDQVIGISSNACITMRSFESRHIDNSLPTALYIFLGQIIKSPICITLSILSIINEKYPVLSELRETPRVCLYNCQHSIVMAGTSTNTPVKLSLQHQSSLPLIQNISTSGRENFINIHKITILVFCVPDFILKVLY